MLLLAACVHNAAVCDCSHVWMLAACVYNAAICHCSQTLESLCTNLYDALRPLIIHINHLETLAELCSILKVGYLVS